MHPGLGLLTACSSSSKTTASNLPARHGTSTTAMSGMAPSASSGSSGVANDETIHIKNFAFTVPSHVSPGQKITIHNEDGEAHTVTSETGGAFNVDVPASSTATLTAPTTPGTYKFHCNFHGQMHGTLTVG